MYDSNKSCRDCTLPVSPYKGQVEQVYEDLCEACFLTGEVPMDFIPRKSNKNHPTTTAALHVSTVESCKSDHPDYKDTTKELL
jgi:hypothetical protein